MMRNLCLLLCAITTAASLLPHATGQEPDKNLRSYFELPNGATMTYRWRKGQSGPEVFSILYPGSSEWLADQKHVKSHWHTLASLEEIDIYMADDLKAEALDYIAGLKTVRKLSIDETRFYKGALAPLEKMTKLKTLSINCNAQLLRLASDDRGSASYESPRGSCFSFLGKLSSLESLSLWPECDEPTFAYICEMKQIKRLALGNLAITSDKGAASLATLPQLKNISFSKIKNPDFMLRGIQGHTSVNSLSFDTETLSRPHIELISTIKHLQDLHIHGTRIGALTSLGACVELRKLHVYYDVYESQDGCKFLSHLPNLESITLSNITTRDFSIDNLRDHKKLNTLAVGAILSRDDIAILESMKELRTLAVGNAVDSDWIALAKRRLPKVTIIGGDAK